MPDLHAWDLEPSKAVEVQNRMRERLVLEWDGRKVVTIGGIDVSYRAGKGFAAIVVMRFPELIPVEGLTAQVGVGFPYIPGLLAFREAPAVIAAWSKVTTKPDLLMFDAHGIAHPRGIGLASHLGLWFGIPSIGVAKSRLYGHHKLVGLNRGEAVELIDENDPTRVIGTVLRTRTNVKPVYVTPGHLIDVPNSARFVMACCTRYRLPEPTRWADKIAGGAVLHVKREPQ